MMEKTAGVYAWVNLVNGKVYVGSAENLRRRKYHHVAKLKIGKHSNPHLQAAWDNYGVDNFDFIVLEAVTDLLWLRAREHAWILRLQAANREFGYNASTDAWAPISSEETKAKLRQAWVGRKARGDYYKFSKVDQEKSQAACKGRPWSRTQRIKLGKSRKPWTPERRVAQARRFQQQKLDDPTFLSRGGKRGSAVRWNKEN
jgi:group I intron endonuclease